MQARSIAGTIDRDAGEQHALDRSGLRLPAGNRSCTSGSATSASTCTSSGFVGRAVDPTTPTDRLQHLVVADRGAQQLGISSAWAIALTSGTAPSRIRTPRRHLVAALRHMAEEGRAKRAQVAVLGQRPADDKIIRDVAIEVEAGDGVEVRDLDVGHAAEGRLDSL